MSDPFADLLQRADLESAVFTGDEVSCWPDGVSARLVHAGLLRPIAGALSIECDACGEGHIEEVQFVAAAPGRAYITCPENGRVRVDEARLRQWDIDFTRLTESLAAALAVAGRVEELVASRLWLLGKMAIGGRSRDVFLARGLGWHSGPQIIASAPRLLAASCPLVLVPSAAPPLAIWNGDARDVLTLSGLVSMNDGSLVVDRDYVESALGKNRSKKIVARLKSFATPQGASWDEPRIIVSDLDLEIEVRGKRDKFTFAEAGFEERRKGNVPDRLWRLLKIFALRGGIVPFDDPELTSDPSNKLKQNLKQNVRQLRQRLCSLLQIDGDPFKDARKTRRYEARFKISTEMTVLFPTPAGATWDKVAIQELDDERIAFSLESKERFVTYARGRGDDDEDGGWEGAEGEGLVRREYDVVTLGLATREGKVTDAGDALRAVLRAGGKVKRDDDDEGMLKLCGVLTKVMQISSSPFQFSKSEKKWSALFEASSTVPNERR